MLSKEEVEAYCDETYGSVYRFCMSLLNNKEDAEDATQDTFTVFSNKGHMVEPEHAKAWIFTTAYHMIQKEWTRRTLARKRERELDEDVLALANRVQSFEKDIIDYYGEKYEEDIRARLNEKEKMLFDLYSDGNLKTGRIAQILAIDPHACSMRKKRLIERCREITLEIFFY